MIIDCHSHVGTENKQSCFYCYPGEPFGPLAAERFAAHAAAQPVDYMLVSSGMGGDNSAEALRRANREVVEAVRQHPRKFGGLCQINPLQVETSLAEIEKHIAGGDMAGIGEVCQYIQGYETDHPGMSPILERAVELDVPVQVHSSTEQHTDELDRLAPRFPRARLIMAHIGGMYNWYNGLKVAARHENVWVDTSGCVMLFFGALEKTLQKLGASRVLFGVDFPLVGAAPLIAALERLKLPAGDFERIAFRNSAELFKLDLAKIGGQ